VPYIERDVSVDRAAAFQMMRRSGQQGVPVIVAGDDVIVGFDRPRLERIAARYAPEASTGAAGIKLGLAVRNATGGVEVGAVRPGSLGERAGVRPGDVLESLAGQLVRSVADLERLTRNVAAGQGVDLSVRRGGQPLRLLVPVP